MKEGDELPGGGKTERAARTGLGFAAVLEQFNQTLEAILEMLDAIFPHVVSLDKAGKTYSLPPLSEEGQAIVTAAFEAREEGGDELDEAADDEDVEPIAKAFVDAYADNPDALRMLSRTITALLARPQREQILHGSLLTMVVGTLETAIAQVVTQHYLLHPDALPRGEKEFSLAELAEFEDLDDARELAVSRRVEGLIRGGLETWDKTFNRLLKIEVSELADDLAVLHEVIQRRHLVVHNAARVSRQYKSQVPECTQAVGETLEIGREYLEGAIDSVAIFGTRLIFVSWAKWKPDDMEDIESSALEIVLPQLSAARNLPARCIASTVETMATREHQRLALRVNRLQAEKRLTGIDSIREEVEGWDTTALAPEFAVAKAALLDEFELLFSMLPVVVEQRRLSPDDVRGWPLFKEARAEEAWAEFEKSLPPPDDQDAEESETDTE